MTIQSIVVRGFAVACLCVLLCGVTACGEDIKVPIDEDAGVDAKAAACTTDDQCKNGEFCFVDHCVALKPAGAPCTLADECKSDECVNDVCGCVAHEDCDTETEYCNHVYNPEGFACKDKLASCETCVDNAQCGAPGECTETANGWLCGERDSLLPLAECCMGPQCIDGYCKNGQCELFLGSTCAEDKECNTDNCLETQVCGCRQCPDGSGCYASEDCVDGLCVKPGDQEEGEFCCRDEQCAETLTCQGDDQNKTCQP